MALPKLNVRQTIEGISLTFNAEAAAGLYAIIQFDVTGDKTGVYHLSITNGECHFHIGPAFIFTSAYQKRVPIANPKLTETHLRFWAGMGLSAVSGLLLTASMPDLDVSFLGWIALVPLLLVITTSPVKKHYVLALPFGLLLSIGVHNWYPNIFPPVLGYFLIVAVGTFYTGMIQLGTWHALYADNALSLPLDH